MKWLELFAGGGGVGQGLTDAGHEVATAIEIDPVAAACYQANHPHTKVIVSDVRDVDPYSLSQDIQAVWMSPTCKQHSQARNRSLAPRDDADIGLAALPYIEAINPELVILENVKQYRSHPSFTTIVTFLVKRGYTVDMRIVNAAHYGIPQHRERLLLQARKGIVSWPARSKHIVSWYEALADMFDDMPTSDLANWQRQLWKAEYNAMAPVMVHSQYDFHEKGEPKQLALIGSDKPAFTVTSSHNSTQKRIVLEDGRIVCLTPKASARLQTFPDNYIFPTGTGAASTIIGNAVPCSLVQQLTLPYAKMESERAA